MPMRLQEIHPALVHFPIALLPTALAADALGEITGRRDLMEAGRRLMPIAAASAAVAGVAGLVAQEVVEAHGEAHDALVTHRTLNIGLIGLTSAMAWGRSRRERPGWGYLALGAAGLAAMSYGAYLGGRMVYELGVGVKPAGGLHEAEAPEYGLTDTPEAARDMVSDAASGAAHAAEDARGGEVAPAL